MAQAPQITLNPKQAFAIEALKSKANLFLTGPAGTGKTFVINHFLAETEKTIPILASTGAAAVLIKGRTFHSYFGLGIMKGGIAETVKTALQRPQIRQKIASDDTLIIDEISMIHPDAFEAASLIAKRVKGNQEPFGGMRLILVGDFLQLPPVDVYTKDIPWIFNTKLWQDLDLGIIELTQSMRTDNQDFVDILNTVRYGRLNQRAREFLDSKVVDLKSEFDGTVLLGKRAQAEAYNLARLKKLKDKQVEYPTEVITQQKTHKTATQLIALTPLPEVLFLKVGALVMLRKNDAINHFVNGSLAHVKKLEAHSIVVTLLSGRDVKLDKETFEVIGPDGKVIASITNFPLSLAWATTIHKSQGASIDRIHVDLRNLWENGQAYVALSRARSPEGLFLQGWKPECIKAAAEVVRFYKQ